MFNSLFMKLPPSVFFLLFTMQIAGAQSLFDSLYQPQVVNVYFQSGSSEIDPSASRALDSAVVLFNRIKTPHTTRITAHTDSVGNTQFNEQLAKKRANAVVAGLQERGIPVSGIIVSTFGERNPAATNNTETGRQKNRRATIEIAGMAPMATYSGRITDKNTGKGIEASLYFRSKTRTDSTRTDTTGFYNVRLPKDTVVKVDVIAPGYFFESQAFKVLGSPDLYAKYKSSPDIVLAPAAAGEKAVIRNLFFVGDQAVLLRASEPELPKILKFMQVNKDIRIEIAGHVNVPYQSDDLKLKKYMTEAAKAEAVMAAQPEWKQGLSEQRAKTVYDYLIKNGISADRLQYKGYKNSEMLFPHATSMGDQEQNRRVEIKVLN